MSKEKIEIPDKYAAAPSWLVAVLACFIFVASSLCFFMIGEEFGEDWRQNKAIGDGYFQYENKFYRVERIEGDVRLIDEVPYFVLPLGFDETDNQPVEEEDDE